MCGKLLVTCCFGYNTVNILLYILYICCSQYFNDKELLGEFSGEWKIRGKESDERMTKTELSVQLVYMLEG